MRNIRLNRLKAAVALLAVIGPGCQAEPTGVQSAGPAAAGQPPALSVGAGVAGSVTGSAHLTVFPGAPPGLATRNFTVSAVEQADGSVSGEWEIVAGGTILHGDVDCMWIAPDGVSARISGIVTDAKFTTFQVGTAFAMELFDNGNGASGDPDITTQLRAFKNLAPAAGRAFCEDGTVPTGADLDPLPTEEGNFQIRTGA